MVSEMSVVSKVSGMREVTEVSPFIIKVLQQDWGIYFGWGGAEGGGVREGSKNPKVNVCRVSSPPHPLMVCEERSSPRHEWSIYIYIYIDIYIYILVFEV